MRGDVGIFPSIMCGRPWELSDYLAAFERVGVTAIHFDVMDGHYVPNVMLGTDDFRAIRTSTDLSLDVHLMVTEPEGFVPYFELREGDRCSFHPEVCRQPYRLLERLRGMGVGAGLALSPGVPIGYVEECLGVLDFVLVMAVSPGFAGQRMVPDHLERLRRLRELVRVADRPIQIVVDGNTTVGNARRMLDAGASGLVVGTSSMMGEGPSEFERLHDAYLAALG